MNSPSRNHLVFTSGCLDGYEYLDVGFELSSHIEEIVGDRRLSMRVQDKLNNILRAHIRKSEGLGEYVALTNIGILFEPLLKIDLEGFLNRWSQNTVLFWDLGKGAVIDNSLYLVEGCSRDYSVSLEGINYIEYYHK